MMNLAIRSLCLIIIGVLMIVFRESLMPIIIQLIGASFVVSGIISLFNVYILHKRKLSRTFDAVVLAFVGTAGVVFGAWLLLSPAFFLSLLMLLLGICLFVLGFYQLLGVLVVARKAKVSGFMYVVPVMLLIAGVFVIVNPFTVAGLPFLVVGIGAVLAGISDFVMALLVIKNRKSVGQLQRE